jgi:transcriptional regulator with XRE-family HTH domain
MRDETETDLERRLAARIAALRLERALSLDDLAARTGISRATLSRIERAEVSPTAAQLGRLAAAFGWTVSRLMAAAEGGAPMLVKAADQTRWTDPETGFRRRIVSPPGPGLRVEIIEGELPAGAAVAYPGPPMPGMEQHIVMIAGALDFTIEGDTHRIKAGDCLRAVLRGPTRLHAPGPEPARYLIAICPP